MDNFIDQHLDWAILEGNRPGTCAVRGRVLRHFLAGDRDPLTVTRADVMAFLARPLAPQSRAAYLAHLKAFYKWLSDERLLTGPDPTVGLHGPKLPRPVPHPISDSDLRMALTTAPEPLRTWFLIASHQGLRACEIAPLAAEDIVDGRLLIRDGKGGRSDWLPMHPLVEARLAELSTRPGPFWPGLRASMVTERCNRWLRGHGSAYTLHACRHWAATSILRSSGGNLRVAQDLLRHSSPDTTARYTQVVGTELSAALAKIGIGAA